MPALSPGEIRPSQLAAASDALGTSLMAALSHPYITTLPVAGAKGKSKPKFAPNKMFESKKTEPTSAIEAVMGLLGDRSDSDDDGLA